MQQNLVGQKLGRYAIREMLGMGGMGAVYRAYQEDLKREVALKVIAANYSGQEELVARFIREAQTAAGLEHAHIVPIYDYGVISSQLYIVMRMLTGGTLSDRIEAARRSGKLPSPNECAKLLDQLAGALDYAHERGVIHRDIKPGNIMFDNHGDAFLVDFGIAKAGDSTNLTRGSSVIGSPNYMSPEQWRGEPAGAGADQYALGVVIYTMLTGKLPFEADTPYAVMQLHVNTPPPSPITHRADLPPSVGMVLEKALAKNAADRFPTMRAFSSAFRLAVGDTRPGTETGFFTRTIERTMKTAILPGGSGSQSGARQPSPSQSQNVSQTLRQQRVGLAVGLGAGLVIAVIVGVLLLMQSSANANVLATQTAIQATLVGMSAGTSTAEAAIPPTSEPTNTQPPTEAAPTESGADETDEPATSVAVVPTEADTVAPTATETASPVPTETLTPSPTITLTPSATETSTLSPTQEAGTTTAVQVLALAAASTENAVQTGTARANAQATATEGVRLTAVALTADANATETQIAESAATQAAIGTNAASTFQAEDRATQQAVDLAATLDAIVGATRSALNTQAAATNDARQATLDALNTQVAATAAAVDATNTAVQQQQDANATAARQEQFAYETATQIAAETQSAVNAQATGAAETATQDAQATQRALDQAQTAEFETATQRASEAQSAATATRAAELQAINETLQAVQQAQTEAAAFPTEDSTQTVVIINQTATAARVVGTMQALDARATALRLTATSRAISTPVPTATGERSLTPTSVLPSPTASPPSVLPTSTPAFNLGAPGVFSPGDVIDQRVLTTTDDGQISGTLLDVYANDLYVETVFEIPDTDSYWDFGIALREQTTDPDREIRFFIDYGNHWIVSLGTEPQEYGEFPASLLKSDVGATNRLTLVAFDHTGVALLNGVVISVMDFSSILVPGTSYIGTGFALGSDVGVDVVIRSINAAPLTPAFGPVDGSIPHDPANDTVGGIVADDLAPSAFIARGVFSVPYSLSQGGWDIGFKFRNREGVVFDSIILDPARESWYAYHFDGSFVPLSSGALSNLNSTITQTNEVIVIIVREYGYLIVNGQAVGEFKLTDGGSAGSVEINTGLFTGNELAGAATDFEDFTVWTFSDQP